jgi:glycosyltransferase involved in cell wall biosynthesis
MNVAIFTDNDFDKVNGVTTTLQAALDHAPPSQRLRIYTAGAIGRELPEYLSLRSFGVPIPFYGEMQMYVPRIGAYLRHAKEDAIDVVHLTTPGPIGLAAMYVASRLHLPLVGSFHTDLAAYTTLLSGSTRLGTLMREYMRWPYSRCRRVLVPSEATRTLLLGAKGDPRTLRVWPRGVDAEHFRPDRRSLALREAWHVDHRRPAILYVGRVSREKGLDLLVPLHHRLLERGLQHRLIIAGQGPMLEELRGRLPDAVFTGVLTREEVADAFASADLFLFPSRTDTAGNVVLEAQASGLPVVVSDAGGPAENMLRHRTGFTCGSTDPDEWAAAVAAILRSPLRHEAMRARARAYAQTRQWAQALQPLYDAYEDAAAGQTVRTLPPVGPMIRGAKA